MNPVILDWPEDETDLWPWLESQLTSNCLRSLVQQLESFQQSSENNIPPLDAQQQLREVFGGGLPEMLRSGLLGLDDATRQKLLNCISRQPRLLLTLQEIVLCDGSDYWDKVSRTDMSGKPSPFELFRPSSLPQMSVASTTISTAKVEAKDRRWLLALTALAATVVVGVTVWLLDSGSLANRTDGQFFARRGLLETPSTEAELVVRIATSVRRDWREFDGTFREKLLALRDSCDILLAARLDQLSDSKRKDLRERCQKWKSTLTEYLQQLDAQGDLDEIRANADATVDKLTRAIEQLA